MVLYLGMIVKEIGHSLTPEETGLTFQDPSNMAKRGSERMQVQPPGHFLASTPRSPGAIIPFQTGIQSSMRERRFG